jgi:hypothetical protein
MKPEPYIGAKVVLARDPDGTITDRGRVVEVFWKEVPVLVCDIETRGLTLSQDTGTLRPRKWVDTVLYARVQRDARTKVDGSSRYPIYEFSRDLCGEILEIPGDHIEYPHKYDHS